MAEEFNEHECYDCLGVFPGHVLKRKTLRSVIGHSTRQADFRNSEDYFDTSRTTSHYGYTDIFLCGGCRSRRFYKAMFKWLVVPFSLIAGASYWLHNSYSGPQDFPFISTEHDSDQSQLDDDAENVSAGELLADTAREEEAGNIPASELETDVAVASDVASEVATELSSIDTATIAPNVAEPNKLGTALTQSSDTETIAQSMARLVSVKGDPTVWFTEDHYPSRALRQQEEGSVGYTLTVGPSGRVESCSTTHSSGSTSLDKETCRGLTRRARFHPALSDEGLPIQSSFDGTVSWVLPQ